MKKILFAIAGLVAINQDVMAQGCSVCTKTAAGLGQAGAQGLNNGILYLAAIPLIFLGTVGCIWYKRTKAAPGE